MTKFFEARLYNTVLAIGLCFSTASAQEEHPAVKLYVDGGRLDTTILSADARQRIETRVTQWIDQTGIAEQGYSNFYVIPTFHVLSSSKDVAGAMPIYLKECELSLTVERHVYRGSGFATFNTVTRRLFGSGTSEQDALTNAINGLPGADEEFVGFVRQTRTKISDYYRTHCPEVIDEANQAFGFGDFGRSIALYFSIPSDAPCYKLAQDGLQKAYAKYVDYDCKNKLIRLKAYVAKAQSVDSNVSRDEYNNAVAVIEKLDPASKACFLEATQIIMKIESRFDEHQKQTWELKKKQAADDAELRKEMVKTVGRISHDYQPGPTVIIAH
ncbi:MAG TPA: hypothetical protein VGM89_01500 [Puia sp.]|jgi:hypothetical protein